LRGTKKRKKKLITLLGDPSSLPRSAVCAACAIQLTFWKGCAGKVVLREKDFVKVPATANAAGWKNEQCHFKEAEKKKAFLYAPMQPQSNKTHTTTHKPHPQSRITWHG
jgi:hypothetical protein